MIFTVNASLLDAIVLSVVSKEDTYGYKITQEVNNIIGISESTLYPVLRRLQKDNDLEVYDMEYLGRNRRYYKITNKGRILLSLYKEEWEMYKQKIDKVFAKDNKDGKDGKGKNKSDKNEEHKNINIGELIESLKINEKLENFKLAEKLENLKIDEKIELLKSEGVKLGKKFDNFITNKTQKSDKPNKSDNPDKSEQTDNTDDINDINVDEKDSIDTDSTDE